jgi:hypothetical protein
MPGFVAFLQHVVLWVLGEFVGDLLFPGKPEPRPAEGDWNASLGTIAIFVAGLSGMFGFGAVITLVHPDTSPPEPWWAYVLAVGSAGVAWIAFRLGRRTLVVTRRRHLLAWTAMALAMVTIIGCLGTVIVVAL